MKKGNPIIVTCVIIDTTALDAVLPNCFKFYSFCNPTINKGDSNTLHSSCVVIG